MKKTLLIILTFLALNLFGQKSDIESFTSQVAEYEVPKNFEYYFLVPESLEHPKICDSLQNYQTYEFKRFDKNFPTNLIYQQSQEITDWKNYNLQKVKYIINEYNYQTTSPPRSKNVQFVKFNISQKEYDSLIDNKEPHSLIVRKKWFWNKNKIWKNKKFHNELIDAWNKDEKRNLEEKIYFQFSKPIFSTDRKYARISVFKNRRCKGIGFTALYRNDNGIWKKLIEYNQVVSVTIVTHSECKDISISYFE